MIRAIHYRRFDHPKYRFILAQIGSIFFVAGLPGWTIVRAFFVWSESHRKSTLPEILEEAKKVWKR